MQRSVLGATGVEVSVLGLGAGALGEARVSAVEAEALLETALECGVTLVDTARSYGLSEERIGAFARRGALVVSTKGGYGVEGVPDWTAEAVRRGVDGALGRMRLERVDVFHLHSCPLETAQREDLVEVLERAREAGKIGIAAYSGENEALEWCVGSGRFGSVQCSVNVFDQGALSGAIAEARARGVGVIGKRALGNAPWRFGERPVGDYAEVYWERMRAMELDPSPLGWEALALRFAAFAPGVAGVLVGTSRARHLRECVRIVEEGPLPWEVVARVREAFEARGGGWSGQV